MGVCCGGVCVGCVCVCRGVSNREGVGCVGVCLLVYLAVSSGNVYGSRGSLLMSPR